jgi:hypothetical protein
MTFHREQETYDRQRQPMLGVGDLFRRLRCQWACDKHTVKKSC